MIRMRNLPYRSGLIKTSIISIPLIRRVRGDMLQVRTSRKIDVHTIEWKIINKT